MNIVLKIFLPIILAPMSLYGMNDDVLLHQPSHTKKRSGSSSSPLLKKALSRTAKQFAMFKEQLFFNDLVEVGKKYNEANELYIKINEPSGELKKLYDQATSALSKDFFNEENQKALLLQAAQDVVDKFFGQCAADLNISFEMSDEECDTFDTENKENILIGDDFLVDSAFWNDFYNIPKN